MSGRKDRPFFLCGAPMKEMEEEQMQMQMQEMLQKLQKGKSAESKDR